LKSLAGISIPDTKLANAAVDLLEMTSPEFLSNHCMRVYIFGSLAIHQAARGAIDEEIAFCSAVLHDLGLVPSHSGTNRFEVDGADAARKFCLVHQVSPARADRAWEAIALHTSAGIASRMATETALVHLGAGVDVMGLGIDQVPRVVLEEVLENYPRLNFKSGFQELLAANCRANPAAQILTWTDDFARVNGCTLHGEPIPTATQLLRNAPFRE
jgi:hypothetical protein